MSSFDRRSFLVGLAALPLGACNLTPVYGPDGSGSILQDRIRIADPENRLEFALVARFEDRLGSGAAYDLDYTLTTGRRNLGVNGAASVSRVNLVGSLAYRLRDAASGVLLDQGEVSSFSAYATAPSPLSTDTARRDAEARLAVLLADQLVTRLIATAPRWS